MQKLDTAVQRYLAISEQYTSFPSDPAEQVAFFDENDSRLAEVRLDFGDWSQRLEDALASGVAFPSYQSSEGLRDYRDAFDAWISAQEEQARLSRACIADNTTMQARANCYSVMSAENGDRWDGTAARLSQIAEDLQGP